jgi:3'-5' exoribonuclease
MKGLFVEELKNGEVVDAIFLVRDKMLSATKDGRPYIRLNLIDRTGKVEARVWERQGQDNRIEETFKGLSKNAFVRVRGRVETFKETLQINVETIETVDPGGVDAADFVPKGTKNPDDLVRDLTKIAASLADPHLRRLINAFLKDGDFMARFVRAPAAKKLHQAYLGGLIEHTHNIVRMALDVSRYYPQVNGDLLVTGSFLHDIGKIHELDYSRAFDYSDKGRLVGHLFIGARMVDQKIAGIGDFPDELKDLVLHMVLSHHGAHEYGAPVLPATPEAVILYQLDDLDAKVWGFLAEIARSESLEGNWTAFSNVYNRFIYKGDTFVGMGEQEPDRRERKKKDAAAKRLMLGLFDDE